MLQQMAGVLKINFNTEEMTVKMNSLENAVHKVPRKLLVN